MAEKHTTHGPKLSNVRNLAELIRESGYDIRHNGKLSGANVLAMDLDKAGVRAPEADDHPDQAPGRTMTKSEAHDLRRIAQHSDYSGFAGALSMRGITVVPDPEPPLLPSVPGATVKMRNEHRWVRAATGAWISTDGSILDQAGAQELANDHGFEVIHDGVKAPGADDE